MERKKKKIKETSSLSQSRQGPRTCYGATRTPELNQTDFKLVAHNLTNSDTLQGLAIKYGVTVEQIRRVNKLWTNDNILVYKTLNIPIKVKIPHEDDAGSDDVKLVDITIDVEGGTSTMVSSVGETNSKNGDSLSKFLNKLDDQMKSSIELATQQRTNSGLALINNLETSLEKEILKRQKMGDTNAKKSTTAQVSLMSNQTRQTPPNSNEMSSLNDLYEL